MGQCKSEPHPTDRTHVSYHDPLSPPISTLHRLFKAELTEKFNYSAEDAGVRVVYPSYEALCTQGYVHTI